MKLNKQHCYWIFRHTGKGNKIMSIGSAMLRRFDRSYFDHAELLHHNGKAWVCTGGTFNGVREMNLSDWLKLYKNQSFQICKIPTIKPHKAIRQDSNRMLGTPYDFISLFYHLFRPFTIWFGKKGNKSLKKVYCTEFLAFVSGLPEWHETSVSGIYNLTSIRYPINKKPVD